MVPHNTSSCSLVKIIWCDTVWFNSLTHLALDMVDASSCLFPTCWWLCQEHVLLSPPPSRSSACSALAVAWLCPAWCSTASRSVSVWGFGLKLPFPGLILKFCSPFVWSSFLCLPPVIVSLCLPVVLVFLPPLPSCILPCDYSAFCVFSLVFPFAPCSVVIVSYLVMFCACSRPSVRLSAPIPWVCWMGFVSYFLVLPRLFLQFLYFCISFRIKLAFV